MAKKLNELSISKAQALLDKREVSSVEIVKDCLSEIKKRNENLNAYLEVFEDVLDNAKEVDKLRTDNLSEKGLLGIPFASKDNILIEGKKATAGSKIFEGYVAPYDATVIKKLKLQKTVFLGRTNMDEFAMGSSTENSAFGVTKNPIDKTCVAGGSSGGSVREPASFCGLVGLKPTYGALSRSGLIALGSSLDVIGPITKTVTDS